MTNNKKKKIFIFDSASPESGCYYYRGDVFLRYSKKFKISSNVDFVKGVYIDLQDVASKIYDADIVIFLRPTNPNYLSLLEVLRLSGKKVFIDNDDDFSTIDRHNPAYLMKKNGATTNDIFVKMSDGVIGSTDSLTSKMRLLNKNAVTAPNLIDFNEFGGNDLTKKKYVEDRVRIGITGSAATLENTSNFIHILQKIEGKYREKIKFVFFSDKKSLERLEKNFSYRSEFVEAVPFQQYANKLASLDLDIVLIPRKDNEFNRYKSNCKYLELATLDIAVIAQGFTTKDGPYDRDIEHKVNGMIVYNDNEWIESVEYLLNQKNREKIIKNANKFVKENYDIQNKIDLWDNAIGQLLNKCNDVNNKDGYISVSFYNHLLNDLYCVNQKKRIINQKTQELEQKNQIIQQKQHEIKQMQFSKSFRLGNLFFRSLESPYKILTFPINFVRILLNYDK